MIVEWAHIERLARKAALALVVLLIAFMAGQFSAASAMATAAVEQGLNDWVSGDLTKMQALDRFRSCERTGPALTVAGCVGQATSSETGAALSNELRKAQERASRNTPAPLSWLIN